MHRNAFLSDDRKHRYTLERIWDEVKPLAFFVMLNPSCADSHVDDPTVTKCVGIAKRNGFGGILVGNLYSLRTSDPSELFKALSSALGPETNAGLEKMRRRAGRREDKAIVAWGNHGADPRVLHRKQEVLDMLGQPLYRLGELTGQGEPSHPLRLPYDTPLLDYP